MHGVGYGLRLTFLYNAIFWEDEPFSISLRCTLSKDNGQHVLTGVYSWPFVLLCGPDVYLFAGMLSPYQGANSVLELGTVNPSNLILSVCF